MEEATAEKGTRVPAKKTGFDPNTFRRFSILPRYWLLRASRPRMKSRISSKSNSCLATSCVGRRLPSEVPSGCWKKTWLPSTAKRSSLKGAE